MRNQSLGSNIGAVLRRCKKMETSLRRAGMPAFLACLPMALLAWQYALILHEKKRQHRPHQPPHPALERHRVGIVGP